MLSFGYQKKKKLYREYANENLNLAFGANEFGEVIAEVKEQILADANGKSSLTWSAVKMIPYLKAKIVFMPILLVLTDCITNKYYEWGDSFEIAIFSFVCGLIMFLCARRIAKSPTRVKLGQIVNSKVVLGDNYLEYSYSSIDPKATEGIKNTNFVVCRMKYSDISTVRYNKKKNSYLLDGPYHVRRYKNYSIKDPDPQSMDEDVRGKGLEIYDVYNNRDLFALISSKINKKVGLVGTDVNEKSKLNLCTIVFGFGVVCDAVMYALLLWRTVFGIFGV